MASGEKCGLKSTDESVEVYAMISDYTSFRGEPIKMLIGIFASLRDLKLAKNWRQGHDSLRYEKCLLTIKKIEDVELE